MNSGNFPDIDPANNDSLAGTIQFAFGKLLQGVNGMLPAQVIKYDRANNRVSVQILIAVVTTQGAQVSRPQLASIPVLALGGGDVFLNFNLRPGNLGWVVANDRDISLFLQTYKQTAPNSGRIKDFADAMFIPDIMTGYTINSDDVNNAVLSTKDGTSRISIGASGITITSSSTVTIAGNGKITGTFEIDGVLTGDSGANLSGTIMLTGLGTFPFTMTP